MKKHARIIAAHLLNDFSGSPKVLKQLLNGWIYNGYEPHLFTSLHKKGFLSDIDGVSHHHAWYRFRSNPWLRLLFFGLSQGLLFFRLLFFLKRNDLVYINTVLPFGAALAGKIRGCRVIYHIHESTINPAILKWFLLKVVQWTARDVVYVSQYVANSHKLKTPRTHLLYNAIESSFLKKASKHLKTQKPGKLLMVCSLRAYKGLFEYVELARNNTDYGFTLVINATQEEIDIFFEGTNLPENLCVFDAQTDLHPFYREADLVLNLSRPDGWIETFGLTIIEGMAYGLPAIVPPLGGITEVISEGETGYMADSRNQEVLQKAFNDVFKDDNHYFWLSNNARKRLALFTENEFRRKSLAIISKS